MTSVAISLHVLRKYEVGMPRRKGEQKSDASQDSDIVSHKTKDCRDVAGWKREKSSSSNVFQLGTRRYMGRYGRPRRINTIASLSFAST